MSNRVDLADLLRSWPYDPDNNVRIVRGQDSREVLQVRLPLGIEQLELDGRPDSLRPHGRESLLEYHLARFAAAQEAGQASSFELSPEECAELFHEGTIYYFRYVHCFQLKDWSRTVRDTARNIRLFDFVHQYAAQEEDQHYLEKWRPYILRINALARAMLELDQARYKAALQIVENGIRAVENLASIEDEIFQFEQRRSLSALREVAAQLEQTRPISELERLERQLQRAIQAQDFERAALLRDRIRAFGKNSGSSRGERGG